MPSTDQPDLIASSISRIRRRYLYHSTFRRRLRRWDKLIALLRERFGRQYWVECQQKSDAHNDPIANAPIPKRKLTRFRQ